MSALFYFSLFWSVVLIAAGAFFIYMLLRFEEMTDLCDDNKNSERTTGDVWFVGLVVLIALVFLWLRYFHVTY